MQKNNFTPKFSLIFMAFALLIIASCKKDNNGSGSGGGGTNVIVNATPVKMGLFERDTDIYKLLYVDVATVGTGKKEYDLLFDTGSGGMVLDAQGILPDKMITANGFTFTGDSTTVAGIVITNQKSIITYGDDDSTETKVYGNLAYAPVTIGDPSGNVTIKRLPFFLYYKAIDANGTKEEVHNFDTFGVSDEYDITFSNGVSIQSPFSYFTPGTGLTKGFKMAALGTSNFTSQGFFVPNVVTIGLTASDLAVSSGFLMHQLTFQSGDGYAPIIPSTIGYNGRTFNAQSVFDTGTTPYSYIEDRSAKPGINLLPANTEVSINTTEGFSDSYSVSLTNNITYVENPSASGNAISIFGLPFFLTNSYLLNYENHNIGLKNN
jgi:hypothetical protein